MRGWVRRLWELKSAEKVRNALKKTEDAQPQPTIIAAVFPDDVSAAIPIDEVVSGKIFPVLVRVVQDRAPKCINTSAGWLRRSVWADADKFSAGARVLGVKMSRPGRLVRKDALVRQRPPAEVEVETVAPTTTVAAGAAATDRQPSAMPLLTLYAGDFKPPREMNFDKLERVAVARAELLASALHDLTRDFTEAARTYEMAVGRDFDYDRAAAHICWASAAFDKEWVKYEEALPQALGDAGLLVLPDAVPAPTVGVPPSVTKALGADILSADWEDATALVADRRAVLSGGTAYVPIAMARELAIERARSRQRQATEATDVGAMVDAGDRRYMYLVRGLTSHLRRCAPKPAQRTRRAPLRTVAQAMSGPAPPCFRKMVRRLRSGEKFGYARRLWLINFLIAAGADADLILGVLAAGYPGERLRMFQSGIKAQVESGKVYARGCDKTFSEYGACPHLGDKQACAEACGIDFVVHPNQAIDRMRVEIAYEAFAGETGADSGSDSDGDSNASYEW
jgi:hypothetical protein